LPNVFPVLISVDGHPPESELRHRHIGGGAAGFAAALTSAISGWATVIFAPPAVFPPGRTAALLQGSIDVLAGLGVWPALETSAAPLRAIRIVDATKRLIRAPEAIFHASELGLPAFGYNVPNGELVAALGHRSRELGNLTVVEIPVEAVVPGERSVLIQAGPRAFQSGSSSRPMGRGRWRARLPGSGCEAGSTARRRWSAPLA
jgi:2-octaprenyl-6-methoxyphenol hydroxylase